MAQEPLQEYAYNADYHPESNNGRHYMTPYSPGHLAGVSATPRAMNPYPLSPLSNDPRDSPYGRESPYGPSQPQSPYQQSYEYQHQHYSQQLPPVSTFMHPEEFVNNGPRTFDSTGQNQPPGMRPRLTTSLSEEEGNLCFQVDVNGICVARREDNHMINGTKLLNVVGMTRGRRDGILKAEKQKRVVKIGPMHLKGVWIPYERALALANQEKITEKLYPLFVHDIGALLYHPSNAARPLPSPVAYQQRSSEHYDEQVDDDRRPRL